MADANPTTNNGISAKEAAQRAAQYLQELIPNVQEVSIEEVQSDEHDLDWLITLGFMTRLHSVIAGGPKEYKLFKVDRTTGNIKWMRLR